MQTTLDRAGRLVAPKELRDRLGLRAGSRVEIREEALASRDRRALGTYAALGAEVVLLD